MKQENLKPQVEITKTQLELAKLTAANRTPDRTPDQTPPDHLSAIPDLPLTNYLATSTPLHSAQANFPYVGNTQDAPESSFHITKPVHFLEQKVC